MPASTFTGLPNPPFSFGTEARTVYLNDRFSTVSQNLDEINTGAWVGDLSTTSDMSVARDSSAGTLRTNWLIPQSGSTTSFDPVSVLVASISDVSGQVFNVRSYGAGGAVDDTSAISDAISAMTNAVGGGTLYFPPGRYRCNFNIPAEDIQIVGANMRQTILEAVAGVSGPVIEVFAGGTATLNPWSGIRDITIDGNSHNNPGLSLRSARGGLMCNLQFFETTEYAIQMDASWSNTLLNIHNSSASGHIIVLAGGNSSTKIMGGQIGDHTTTHASSAIRHTGEASANIHIDNVTFQDFETAVEIDTTGPTDAFAITNCFFESSDNSGSPFSFKAGVAGDRNRVTNIAHNQFSINSNVILIDNFERLTYMGNRSGAGSVVSFGVNANRLFLWGNRYLGGNTIRTGVFVSFDETTLNIAGTDIFDTSRNMTGVASITQNLLPTTDVAHNLGQSGGAWRDTFSRRFLQSGATMRVEIPFTPASGTASGTTGDIVWDSDFVYVCESTDSWVRATLARF